ncbi:hypothetical protein BDZ89DRAFT_1061230 [Hymenopellis radicata]|nr:hypothetical protein BDZ89DRAFT_1061230 [Hymenopellis radicata]
MTILSDGRSVSTAVIVHDQEHSRPIFSACSNHDRSSPITWAAISPSPTSCLDPDHTMRGSFLHGSRLATAFIPPSPTLRHQARRGLFPYHPTSWIAPRLLTPYAVLHYL